MHITDFKLEDDKTYWEAFASKREGDTFTIRVRVIPTPTAHSLLIRDYETGTLLDEKRLTPHLLANTVRAAAEVFAKKHLGEI